jgi:hypothetical protein
MMTIALGAKPTEYWRSILPTGSNYGAMKSWFIEPRGPAVLCADLTSLGEGR